MTGSERLRSWFLRNLLETVERELGPNALVDLLDRVPARVRPHLSLDRLRAAAALDAIPLDEGEEALLALEQGLGDGSGRLLERMAREMLARQLVQAAAAVRVGDLFGTVARLRGPLEHPFIDTNLTFELERSHTGFTLIIGVPGRPRATRVLGHIAAGAILAAERFAREAHVEPLRLFAETFADRARIEARFRRASEAPPPFAPMPTSTRRPSGGPRTQPSLSDEVARILDSTLAGRAREREDEQAPRKSSNPELLASKSPSSTIPPPPRRPDLPSRPPPPIAVDPRAPTQPSPRRPSRKPPKGEGS